MLVLRAFGVESLRSWVSGSVCIRDGLSMWSCGATTRQYPRHKGTGATEFLFLAGGSIPRDDIRNLHTCMARSPWHTLAKREIEEQDQIGKRGGLAQARKRRWAQLGWYSLGPSFSSILVVGFFGRGWVRSAPLLSPAEDVMQLRVSCWGFPPAARATGRTCSCFRSHPLYLVLFLYLQASLVFFSVPSGAILLDLGGDRLCLSLSR